MSADKGKLLIATGVGVGVGAGLHALFEGHPAAAAPGEPTPPPQTLDDVLAVLKQIAANEATLVQALNLTDEGKVLTDILSAVAPVSGEPIPIFDADVRQTGLLSTNFLADCRKVTNRGHILIKIESSLDVGISFQTVGSILDDFSRATNIGVAIAVAPGDDDSYTLPDTGWQPWVGGRIMIPFAPTTGRLTVWLVKQE